MKTPWWVGPLAALDFEATDKHAHLARIASLALVSEDTPDGPVLGSRLNPDEGWAGGFDLSLLVNPGVPMNPEAAHVTGLTDERLQAEGLDPRTALEQLGHRLAALVAEGVPLVIYNARFDWPLLGYELSRNDIDLRETLDMATLIDPLVIDKAVDKWRKGSRTLANTAQHYGVRLDDAHEAKADAWAALRLARAIGRKYAEKLTPDARELHEWQRRAFSIQRDDVNAYWARTGKPQRMTGTWPEGEDPVEVDKKLAAEAAAKEAEEAAKRVEIAKLEGELLSVRRAMWLNHGCTGALLADDSGEMQCTSCLRDYKRAPLDEVLEWHRNDAVRDQADAKRWRYVRDKGAKEAGLHVASDTHYVRIQLNVAISKALIVAARSTPEEYVRREIDATVDNLRLGIAKPAPVPVVATAPVGALEADDD